MKPLLLDFSSDITGSMHLMETIDAANIGLVISSNLASSNRVRSIHDCVSDPDFHSFCTELAAEFESGVDRYHSSRVSTDVIRDLLRSSAVPFFEHNLQYLLRWIFTVRGIINENPGSNLNIHISEISDNRAIFLYEAEGETSRRPSARFLYQRRDYLPTIIEQFLQHAFPERCKFVKPKTTSLGTRFRKFIRVYGVLLLKFHAHLKNALSRRRFGEMPNINRSNNGIDTGFTVFVSRSPAHTEYLASIVERSRACVLVFESFLIFPRTFLDARKRIDAYVLHVFDLVSVWTIFRAFTRALLRVFTIDLLASVKVEIPSLKLFLDLKQVTLESRVQQFETDLLILALRRLRDMIKFDRVVHCELFSAYAPTLHAELKRVACETIQMNFCGFKPGPGPNFIHSEKLLCFSENQRLDFSKLFPAQSSRFAYHGCAMLHRKLGPVSGSPGMNPIRTAVFFSQPLPGNSKLSSLEKSLESRGIRLKVVLHPRQTEADARTFGVKGDVITNASFVENRSRILGSADILVTRNSNIAYALILAGHPVVNVFFADDDASLSHEYLRGYPLLFSSLPAFDEALPTLEQRIALFHRFREKFVAQDFAGKDYLDLRSFLYH